MRKSVVSARIYKYNDNEKIEIEKLYFSIFRDSKRDIFFKILCSSAHVVEKEKFLILIFFCEIDRFFFHIYVYIYMSFDQSLGKFRTSKRVVISYCQYIEPFN